MKYNTGVHLYKCKSSYYEYTLTNNNIYNTLILYILSVLLLIILLLYSDIYNILFFVMWTILARLTIVSIFSRSYIGILVMLHLLVSLRY